MILQKNRKVIVKGPSPGWFDLEVLDLFEKTSSSIHRTKCLRAQEGDRINDKAPSNKILDSTQVHKSSKCIHVCTSPERAVVAESPEWCKKEFNFAEYLRIRTLVIATACALLLNRTSEIERKHEKANLVVMRIACTCKTKKTQWPL